MPLSLVEKIEFFAKLSLKKGNCVPKFGGGAAALRLIT